jgi:hypothetical protein
MVKGSQVLDIPGQAVLDKRALVGGCVRLRLRVDHERLRAEIAALPVSVWGSAGGRVGVHREAQALFLRGFAPAEGDLPVEDRPALDRLPYARHIIEALIPAPPLRCLLARLPAGVVVSPHIDRAPYFGKTLRIHVPVETHEKAIMWSAGQCYAMQAGEVWVLNNSAMHAVWNADETRPRTHMICDFLPMDALLALLAQGERNLGTYRRDVDARLLNAEPPGAAAVR